MTDSDYVLGLTRTLKAKKIQQGDFVREAGISTDSWARVKKPDHRANGRIMDKIREAAERMKIKPTPAPKP